MASSSSNMEEDVEYTNDEEQSDEDVPIAEKKKDEPKISTMVLNFENKFDCFKACSTPLYLTAAFKQKSTTIGEEDNSYIYTRIGNPTRDALESLLKDLEKAERAFCFTSGMAALSAVSHLLRPGNEILAGVEIYGGSSQLLNKIIPNRGIVVKRVDTTNLAEVQKILIEMKTQKKQNKKKNLVWLESPTNPQQKISNIKEIARMAHEQDALLLVDNSMMSPALSQPLTLGADIVMHSATKFIAGHSDVIAGVLAVKDERLAKKILALQRVEGSGLAPFDCWLCLRGIQTMALRVEKQQENAQKIAEFLMTKVGQGVTQVYYVGLAGHPGHDLHKSQATGAGSVISFLTDIAKLSSHIVRNTKCFSLAVSFVGIEDVNDLIADLDNAIKTGVDRFSSKPIESP